MVHFFLMAYRATERTEARKAQARERIVAAALAQLADGGYASASVQGIAGRAGVATGTVYRHFHSKDALFAEVFRRASGRELEVVSEVAGDDSRPAPERVTAGLEAFARRALAAPTMAFALLAEPVAPAVEAERLTFRRGYRDALAAALDEGIERGELAPQDTRTVAAALVGATAEALVGPLSPAASNGNGRPRARLSREATEALISSVVQFCLNAIGKESADARHRAHA